MISKAFRKKFNRSGARMALSFGLSLVKISPHRFFCGVMQVFGWIWFLNAKHLRKVARESLSMAFGETKTSDEISKTVRTCFDNISRSMTDLVYFAIHPQRVTERFVLEGQEYLDQALSKKKGVVLVTAHFGNFPLMLLELAKLGYHPSVIIKRMRDNEIAEQIYGIMSQVGVKTIYSQPARESVKRSLDVLRDQNILCVLLDQNFGSGSGVFVDFFGRKAATATGPVVLAERTGAQIVLCFTLREGNKYRVVFEPPFVFEDHPDPDERLRRNIAQITQVIERYIRNYPAEWGWMHRRWKTQEA